MRGRQGRGWGFFEFFWVTMNKKKTNRQGLALRFLEEILKEISYVGLEQNERKNFWESEKFQIVLGFEWWVSEEREKCNQNIRFPIFFLFFFLNLPNNVNADMEIEWRQNGYKKPTQHKVHKNYIILHINGGILNLQFLGFENPISPKWPAQNISFPPKNQNGPLLSHIASSTSTSSGPLLYPCMATLSMQSLKHSCFQTLIFKITASK